MIQSLPFFTLPAGVKRFLGTESLYGLSLGMFTLILNLHFIEVGVTEKQIGWITSMGILVMGAFAIPVSIVAKKTGRKKLLVAGISCLAIGCIIFAIARSFALLLCAQLIMSIGFTLVETTEIQLLFHYSKTKRQETQAYSYLFAMFTAFTGAGLLLGGFLPKWIDVPEQGYQNTLLVISVLLLVLAIIRGSLLPQEVQQREQKRGREKKAKISRELWGKLLKFSFFSVLTGAAVSSVQPYLNLFVKLRFDFSNETVSVILAMHGLALFIGSVFSPMLIDRFGVRKTFFWIYFLNIAFCLLLFVNVPPAIFSVLLLVRGGFFTMLTNLVDSLSMSSFKDEDRDLYAGMRAVFRSIGSSVAAFVIGMILAGKNYSLPFLIAGLLLLAGYIYFAKVIRPKFIDSSLE
ncbi:MFS transporter [Bacillus sp. B-jedd]|uniref:MFS transporter n=1 Tax=Bacillus sp. B-jedd TaxID=1476857 RepID=UPI00051571E4|nr:MFS transporter [Bacillus sp. B-jedd]CEG28481.1 major facilitator superfamily protein [Bacillus sp. B-jedd]